MRTEATHVQQEMQCDHVSMPSGSLSPRYEISDEIDRGAH